MVMDPSMLNQAGVASAAIPGGGSPFPPAGTSPMGTKHVKKRRGGKKKRAAKRRKSKK